MATPKPRTRAELGEDVARIKTAYDDVVRERNATMEHNKQLRTSLDDVKQRLAFSEAEVQRMGGYISRVQEDDVVREPLIQVGEPDGEQQLVPKRKPTRFAELRSISHGGGAMMATASYDDGRDRKPRRHWVNY